MMYVSFFVTDFDDAADDDDDDLGDDDDDDDEVDNLNVPNRRAADTSV
jgi:hypothetical protein